jgi:hypothetical protein
VTNLPSRTERLYQTQKRPPAKRYPRALPHSGLHIDETVTSTTGRGNPHSSARPCRRMQPSANSQTSGRSARRLSLTDVLGKSRAEWRYHLCCPSERSPPSPVSAVRLISYHHAQDSCSDRGRPDVFETFLQALLDEDHDEHPDQLFRRHLPERERIDSISFTLKEKHPSRLTLSYSSSFSPNPAKTADVQAPSRSDSVVYKSAPVERSSS